VFDFFGPRLSDLEKPVTYTVRCDPISEQELIERVMRVLNARHDPLTKDQDAIARQAIAITYRLLSEGKSE